MDCASGTDNFAICTSDCEDTSTGMAMTITGTSRLGCNSNPSVGEVRPIDGSIVPDGEGTMDYYDWEFRHGNWHSNKDDAFAELTPILDKAGSALDEITHLNVMREVLLSDKKKPVVKIEGEISKNLADIPVPNLLINTDWLEDCKRKEERKKFAPIINEGDVAFNYNNDFKGTATITKIDYHRDYENSRPRITIEAIIVDK